MLVARSTGNELRGFAGPRGPVLVGRTFDARPTWFSAYSAPVIGGGGFVDFAGGVGSVTALADGTLALAIGLDGAAGSVTALGTGTLALTLGLSGAGGVTADGTGTLALTLGLSGAAGVTALGAGTLALVLGLAGGTGSVTALGTGTVGLTLGLSGAGTVTALAAGTLVGILGMSGIASVTAAGVASFGLRLGLLGGIGRVTAYAPSIWSGPFWAHRDRLLSLYARRTYVFAATISWQALLRVGQDELAEGDLVYMSDDGSTYVGHDHPNRTGMARGVVRAGGVGVVEVVWGGDVPASITGLGEGTPTMVRANNAGRLERAEPATATDEIVGWCDASGNAVLLFAGFGALPVYRGTAAPVAEAWTRGDIIWNTEPTSGGYAGWICTASGTPGTWRTFGLIS